MVTQRYCACEPTTLRTCLICWGTFEVERKAGRPRLYCFVCEPPGWQVVRLSGSPEWRSRRYGWKLRRRRWGRPVAAIRAEVAEVVRLNGWDDPAA